MLIEDSCTERMRDARYSEFPRDTGLTSPKPPNLGGNAKSSRSVSSGGALPVNEGMKCERIISSRGCRWVLILGIVLVRYDHLLIIPFLKAA